MNTIAEELLLLALNNKKGTILMSASSALVYGIAGGLLVELTLMNRLMLQNKKIIVNDESPVEDELLQQVFQVIKNDPKSRSVKYWVNRLNSRIGGRLKNKLFDRLANKGIVEKEPHHFLWVIQYYHYPLIDYNLKDAIQKRIREEIIYKTGDPEQRTAVLGSLIYACNLLNTVFPSDERRTAKKRLKQIAKNEVYGKVVSESVQALQVAIITSVIAATTISTSSSSS